MTSPMHPAAYKIDGHPAAFLVMYATGGFSQSFPPGLESERYANEHARTIGGYVLALPTLASYVRPSEKPKDPHNWPENKPNITAQEQPPDGSKVIVRSGQNAGKTYWRLDDQGRRAWGDDTRCFWWIEAEGRFVLWVIVQQQIGEADWEIIHAA